jgi:hypothetical protein
MEQRRRRRVLFDIRNLRMKTSMYSPLKWDACQIGVDATRVVAMRLAKMSAGGSGAVAESRRMVSEG